MGANLKTWLRRIGLTLLAIIALCAAVIAILTWRVKLPGEVIVPAGMRRNQAVYVRMRDGVQIAVDVWLPPDLRAGERVPVLMRTTRYWRADRIGWALRALIALHRARPGATIDPETFYFNGRRFAVIAVDARGSGASEGVRVSEYSPDEIADLGEVAGWAAHQEWSNGRVGTFGVSYDGNTAELAAVPNNPVIRAVAPLYDDFDTMLGLERPGGVYDSGMIQEWSDMVGAMDVDDICGIEKLTGWNCWLTRQFVPGIKPVDSDADGKRLKEIISGRHNPALTSSLATTEFSDDNFQTAKGPLNLAQITPYGLQKQIESSGVAMMVWCGWLDAGTCDGSLSRYRNFKNAQQVIIGAFSHGAGFDVDPFLPLDKHRPPNPTQEEQYRMQADFFDKLLRSDPPEAITSGVHYYTLGEGQWHDTAIWPPEGLQNRRYFFAADHALAELAPSEPSANDAYAVDFLTTTGPSNRWKTQLGGFDVIYPDRAEEDKKLLTYTSAPLTSDVEITGSPVLTLEMASTTSDGAIFAYLEDVAPDGRVIYIDEGIFRTINRKIATKPIAYVPLGPPHTYLRADAEPMVPGQSAEITFSLFPTSVLLRKAHRIRLALAGADASMFTRIPADGTSSWTMYREKKRASFLEVPAKMR